MRYLAIDYGSKQTGLAVCDKSETIVSPFKVLNNNKNLKDQINNIVNAENIEAVVIGLPINMDGSMGEQAKITIKFADQLKKIIRIPVYLHDERLSSFAAEEKIAALDIPEKKKKQMLHTVAAAQILENFIEKNKTE